ncbi:MAG: hypothetical protein KatS3mg114_1168 [Planctomycetaceae bacterium]|nr:MAG: hypothetical protein KatS3mg114_1168 [Planctomycetaceae bacterium]
MCGWLMWGLLLLGIGCQKSPTSAVSTKSQTRLEASTADVARFCGACHVTPQPETFPRALWRKEVEFGYRQYLEAGRFDLEPPVQEQVVAWFEARAPQILSWDEQRHVSLAHQPSSLIFSLEHWQTPQPSPHAISRMCNDPKRPQVWYLCDMREGVIWSADFTSSEHLVRPRWKIPHPCGMVPLPETEDASAVWLVADLGSFLPEDHDRGRVWLVGEDPSTAQPLVDGLGRVSHLLMADLTGQGFQEVIVSAFGWRKTGGLYLYRWEHPQRSLRQIAVLDHRPGALRAAVYDFDGDGRVEIVAAMAQQFESLELYRPDATGTYHRLTLYQAPDPAWGSSDFTLVDLDQDGRMDIVWTHGDSFDGGDLRPFHGIIWLRQQGITQGGVPQFSARRLAHMPGVHRTVAGDLDRDGDTDLAAVSLLPASILEQPGRPRLAAVVWLEQTELGVFVPHVLSWERCQHATCELTDIEGDGWLDLLVGHFIWGTAQDTPVLTVYRSLGLSADGQRVRNGQGAVVEGE